MVDNTVTALIKSMSCYLVGKNNGSISKGLFLRLTPFDV